MQHISPKLLNACPYFTPHIQFGEKQLFTLFVTAQVTFVGTFQYGLFFFNPSLVFNLHPQKHSEHMLDIESHGIYNAVFGEMQNKQALYSLRPRF